MSTVILIILGILLSLNLINEIQFDSILQSILIVYLFYGLMAMIIFYFKHQFKKNK